MVVLAIGVVLLVLGTTLLHFVGQQNVQIHQLAFSEVAHFLAEAGLSASMRGVRDALVQSGLAGGTPPGPVIDLLLKPTPLPDTSLMSLVQDSWNNDLKDFAAETDSSARIKVEVWFRDFKQTETDPALWVDPVAKEGWLSIESTGEFKGMRRTIRVRRRVKVGGILPPLTSRFTLYVRDAARGDAGRFNLVRNDRGGSVIDLPRPLVIQNHSTPEAPIEPRSMAEIMTEEKDPQAFQRRGWVWLGGGPVRLHLSAGAGERGEYFQFYEVSNPHTFQPLKFRTPTDQLPAPFHGPVTCFWDKLDEQPRQAPYRFGHLFVLEGFHDRSSRQETDAMYEGDILSSEDKSLFGSRSSLLRLYGEPRPGFQSRTKVFGRVMAAFPRFSMLDITPEEADIADLFARQRPPPVFFLPSMSERSYDPARQIKSFLGGRFGAPVLGVGMLFRDHREYRDVMSGIIELPYNNAYNSIQEIVGGNQDRRFPPRPRS
jgi:hypothetical protein